MIVWVLMTGMFENYGLRGIYDDPLAALDVVGGEWKEDPHRPGTWVNNDYVETAEVFAEEVH